MTVKFCLPGGFHHRALHVRARMYAIALRHLKQPDLALAALLDELATEVELGQCTELTFRGRDAPCVPSSPFRPSA